MEKIQEEDVRIIEIIYKQPGRVEIHKVKHIRSNEILCMKKLFVTNTNEATTIQLESYSMANLEHPNILKPRSAGIGGCGNTITHVYIFMEFFEKGDFETLIQNRAKTRNFLTETEILGYLRQLVSGFTYLQEKNVAHRDIKPQNIFVSDSDQLIIGDLGSAKKEYGHTDDEVTGTPLYLSPKLRNALGRGSYLDHNVYKSDVFSLGLAFLYLSSLQGINDLYQVVDLQSRLKKRISELSPNYPFFKEILGKMLEFHEEDRPDFLNLWKILNKINFATVLTEAEYQNNQFFNLKNFDSACEICKEYTSEADLFILTSGLICRTCYEKAYNFLPVKTKL